MNKIKTFLIHLLGGMTVQESTESDANAWMIGKITTLKGLRQYADSIDGTPADDWCKLMYNRIAEAEETLWKMATDNNGRES